jgi:transducin (beta)-like 1
MSQTQFQAPSSLPPPSSFPSAKPTASSSITTTTTTSTSSLTSSQQTVTNSSLSSSATPFVPIIPIPPLPSDPAMDVDIVGLSPSRQNGEDEGVEQQSSGFSPRKLQQQFMDDGHSSSSSSSIGNVTTTVSSTLGQASKQHDHEETRTKPPHRSMDSSSSSSSQLSKGSKSSKGSEMVNRKPKPESSNQQQKESSWFVKSDSGAGSPSSQESSSKNKLLLSGHAGEVLGCEWNPKKEEMLATCSSDSTVRLWSLQDGIAKSSSAALHHGAKVKPGMRAPTQVMKVVWNSAGNFLASASLDGSLRLWNAGYQVPKTMLHSKLIAHNGPIFSLRWTPALAPIDPSSPSSSSSSSTSRDIVASAGSDGILKLWSVSQPTAAVQTSSSPSPPLSTPLDSISLDQHSILDIDFSSNLLTATASQDGSIKVNNLLAKFGDTINPKQESSSFQPIIFDCKGHTLPVNSVRWSSRTTNALQLLASASDDHTVRLWSGFDVSSSNSTSSSMESVSTLQGHTKEVLMVRWNPNPQEGSQLASASFDGSLKLWDVEIGRCQSTCNGGGGGGSGGGDAGILSLDFSPLGNIIASGSQDKSISIWDSKSGMLLRQYQCSGCVLDVAFNPSNDKLLAACSSDNSAVIFDLRM